MRQPPEKSATGRSRSGPVKPRPSSRAAARARAAYPPISCRRPWRWPISSPLWAASAAARAASLQGRGFLGHVGDHPGGGNFQVAGFLVQLATQEAEQGGLAAAVGAGQADLPAGVDLQAGAFDEGLDAAGEAKVTELDHGSGRGR